MGKKNTLLYLQEDLVELAKRMNLNISELAEAALREELLPMLSAGSRILVHIELYLKDLAKTGHCFFLPLAVKRLEMKNIGPIGSISMDFGPGLNVIKGNCATGKSTILRSMAMAFGVFSPERGHMLSREKGKGHVKITTYSDKRVVEFDRDSQNGKKGVGCLLLDDALARLDTVKAKKFITKLREKYPGQIIMTTVRDDFEPAGAKVFRLDGPDRKRNAT